ncbi:adenine-specific methyltransferase EcoRI family protein [Xylanibacter rarus]|uniref:adenine-specific methyltransferase EcoRI family protein n=1 Tax=Xylanibacter rarus TaxID=1676614 RepID=UPI003AB9B299
MVRNATNGLLQKAKKSKSDEFYTQLCDIERELQYYQGQFEDKIVYCNCDDPRFSNFFKYFVTNFHSLGLKKLITSCYIEYDNNIFQEKDFKPGFYCEYFGKNDKNIEFINFKGNGDFRSAECIELLKQSDIVVTNPPFSLFREFISQIMRYNKKFLVIGNVNAITYKEVFELIQSNKAWLGVNLGRGISGFIVPDHYKRYGTEVSVNSDGQTIIATNSCLWLTNLELSQRHKDIVLTKEYKGNEDKYPHFDNCNGINVNRTQDIPKDYHGLMGVPITFLHKYNPEQFEIVRFRKGDDGKDLRINGKCPYFRILVKNKKIDV